jgi:hypothetical protein
MDWTPKTRLGKMVLNGEVTTMSQALATKLPLREPEIVDILLPDLKDEVIDVNIVQRMTDSGRRVRFRITCAVGNGDGFVGIGMSKGREVGPSIRKAIDNAKLNMIEIKHAPFATVRSRRQGRLGGGPPEAIAARHRTGDWRRCEEPPAASRSEGFLGLRGRAHQDDGELCHCHVRSAQEDRPDSSHRGPEEPPEDRFRASEHPRRRHEHGSSEAGGTGRPKGAVITWLSLS